MFYYYVTEWITHRKQHHSKLSVLEILLHDELGWESRHQDPEQWHTIRRDVVSNVGVVDCQVGQWFIYKLTKY